MSDQPLCNCHGCRFEKPRLEARIAALEQELKSYRPPTPHARAQDCASFEVYVEGAWCLLPWQLEHWEAVAALGPAIVRHPELGEVCVVPRSFPWRAAHG